MDNNEFEKAYLEIITESTVVLPSDSISFKEIDLSDQSDVDLAYRAFNLTAKASHDTGWTEEEVVAFLENYKKYCQKFLAIYAGQEAIGFARIGEYYDGWLDKQTAQLMTFAIFEEFQGKGYGTSALLKVINYIKQKYENTPITLGVAKVNHKAMHLYEKVGFVVVREFKRSYLMELQL